MIAQPEPNNQNGYEEIMMPLNGSAEGTNNFNYNAGEILSQNGSGEESLNTIQVERPLGLEDFLISPAADKVLDDNGKKNEGQEASEKIIAEGGAGLMEIGRSVTSESGGPKSSQGDGEQREPKTGNSRNLVANPLEQLKPPSKSSKRANGVGETTILKQKTIRVTDYTGRVPKNTQPSSARSSEATQKAGSQASTPKTAERSDHESDLGLGISALTGERVDLTEGGASDGEMADDSSAIRNAISILQKLVGFGSPISTGNLGSRGAEEVERLAHMAAALHCAPAPLQSVGGAELNTASQRSTLWAGETEGQRDELAKRLVFSTPSGVGNPGEEGGERESVPDGDNEARYQSELEQKRVHIKAAYPPIFNALEELPSPYRSKAYASWADVEEDEEEELSKQVEKVEAQCYDREQEKRLEARRGAGGSGMEILGRDDVFSVNKAHLILREARADEHIEGVRSAQAIQMSLSTSKQRLMVGNGGRGGRRGDEEEGKAPPNLVTHVINTECEAAIEMGKLIDRPGPTTMFVIISGFSANYNSAQVIFFFV